MMTQHVKTFYCSDIKRELKGFHKLKVNNLFHGCRFPKCCWNWTVFHDKGHCRFFTFFSNGLCWIHWRFRNNCWSPSSSRTFRKQPYWSFIAGEWKFRANSSIIFTILDVRSIFIVSSTMDWYLEVRIQAEDKQYSFCPLIPVTKSRRILKILTWVYHVLHNTCLTHGGNNKTRFVGSMLLMRFGKDWHSIRLDRMQSSLKEYFQLIVFPKLLDWRLEKS